MITGESRPVLREPGRPGGRRDRRHRLGDPGQGRRRGRRHGPGRHPAAWSRRRRHPAAAPRCWPTGSPPAVLRRAGAAAVVTFVVWWALGDLEESVVRTRHGPGDRLPARSRPGHPAGDLAVDRGGGSGRASSSRTGWRWNGCARSTRCCSTRPEPSPRAQHVLVDGRRGERRPTERRRAPPGRRGRGRQRAPAGPGHRDRGARTRRASPRAREFRVARRTWCAGSRRRYDATPSAGPPCCASSDAAVPAELRDGDRASGRGVAPPSCTCSGARRRRRSRAMSLGAFAWRTRYDRRRARPSRNCARSASARSR